MRETLTSLLSKTIIHKYKLTNDISSRSVISTNYDYCFYNDNSNNLVETIYHGILDYVYNEWEIDINKLNTLQKRALRNKIRYDESASEAAKLNYGFYGEVLLNLILMSYFNTKKIIAKGYFYSATDKREPTGYDCFHIVSDEGTINLFLGEVKFYDNYKAALNSILNNLQKALSKDYLSNNFLTIFNKKNDLDKIPENDFINNMISDWEENPDINLYDSIKKYKMKISYPILLTYDIKSKKYDDSIKDIINYILSKKIDFDNDIDADIFFIFLPVEDTKNIKLEVLKWISENTPVI